MGSGCGAYDGGTQVRVTSITEQCVPLPPFGKNFLGAKFEYITPLLTATNTFFGAKFLYNIKYAGFTFDFQGVMP